MQIMPHIKDYWRLIGSLIYLLVGLIIIVAGIIDNIPLFYHSPFENINDWIRILWCLAFSCFGFSIAAYRASKAIHGPGGEAWCLYLTIYPLNLALLSVFAFAVLHIAPQTSNHLFYFLSAPLCFLFSWYIDVWVGNPMKMFKELAQRGAK